MVNLIEIGKWNKSTILRNGNMGDRWEKQSRKPEQVEDNAKALGVSLEEADIVQMKKI